MDTSETYIKMCDCPEIQSLWSEPDAHDYGSKRHHLELTTKAGYRCPNPRDLWLPRQDQLQDMLGGTFGGQLSRLNEWVGKSDFSTWSYCESMEQLWLAFVMIELHNKTWSGSSWEAAN